MSDRVVLRSPWALLLMAVGLALLLLPTAPVFSQAEGYKAVEKAECGPDDRPETGLQGQVPLADRATGFKGFNCNLELVGEYTGDGGAGWQMAWYGDCAYYGGATGYGMANTGAPRPAQKPGAVVIDASDPTEPKLAGRLTSISMIDPWESLKASQKRGLLVAQNANNGGGGREIDVYDVSKNCADPKLLFSGPIGEGVGHSGTLSADGTIYYGSPSSTRGAGVVKAVDITNPRKPKLISEDFPVGTHDLSTSADGNRLYLANTKPNGLAIIDVTEVQQRRKNPKSTVVSEMYWPDGATAQMTIPITVNNKPYIVFVDEGGSKGCQTEFPAYGTARLIDISNEREPKLVSRLDLETHLPENCRELAGDSQGIFQYDAHYCTASNGKGDSTSVAVENAVILACGYFESGLRVFDIRDPENPREIAYYNPPGPLPGPQAASWSNYSGICTTADWTAAHPRIRAKRGEIWFTSQCGGFHIVKLSNDVWPLKPLQS